MYLCHLSCAFCSSNFRQLPLAELPGKVKVLQTGGMMMLLAPGMPGQGAPTSACNNTQVLRLSCDIFWQLRCHPFLTLPWRPFQRGLLDCSTRTEVWNLLVSSFLDTGILQHGTAHTHTHTHNHLHMFQSWKDFLQISSSCQWMRWTIVRWLSYLRSISGTVKLFRTRPSLWLCLVCRGISINLNLRGSVFGCVNGILVHSSKHLSFNQLKRSFWCWPSAILSGAWKHSTPAPILIHFYFYGLWTIRLSNMGWTEAVCLHSP